jgi:hypothetical protein
VAKSLKGRSLLGWGFGVEGLEDLGLQIGRGKGFVEELGGAVLKG